MKNFSAFEMEVLEERLEFGDGFWAWLWDAISWLGESIWDVFQAFFEKASPGGGLNSEWKISVTCSAPGFFAELWDNWVATWEEYW